MALCAALFTAALAWFWLTLTRTFDLKDEGYFLYLASLVAAGDMPHRDFASVYGPGPYWLNGLLLASFDGQILPVRIAIAVFKATAVVLTFLMGRLLVARQFALLGGALALVYWGRFAWNFNAPYGVLYTLPLCMASVVLLIAALGRPSPGRLFASAIPLGVAMLFKQTVPLLVGVALALAIFALWSLEKPARRDRRGPAAGPRWDLT